MKRGTGKSRIDNKREDFCFKLGDPVEKKMENGEESAAKGPKPPPRDDTTVKRRLAFQKSYSLEVRLT